VYGVPEDLDLRPLHGDYLTQVCLGLSDLQFCFGAGGCISVWGHWEVRAADGTVLDQAVEDLAGRDCWRVHRLLMATVTASRLDPPRSFTVLFDNGMSLTVFDDSQQYESCSITLGGDLIVI
jgi:hypothetical protein